MERLSSERETYYECDCEGDFYGKHCDIPKELYISTNLFAAQLLREVVSFMGVSQIPIIILEKLNRVALNKQNLDRITVILELLRGGVNHHLNIQHYLSAVDATMRNYYEIIQEHKRSKSDNFDIDNMEDIKAIFNSIEDFFNYSEDAVRMKVNDQVGHDNTRTRSF